MDNDSNLYVNILQEMREEKKNNSMRRNWNSLKGHMSMKSFDYNMNKRGLPMSMKSFK